MSVARADRARVTAKLRADPAVAYVEADGAAHAEEITPNDPYYPSQIEMPQITVPDAWARTTGSAAVTVALLDTGVTAVGDLAGAVLPGRDFVNNDNDAADDHGHGTSTASLIAARGDNGLGMAGVCWQCRILPVKVLDSDGNGTWSDVAAGIVYAADQGVKIITLAMTGDSPPTVVGDAVTYARGKGAVLFAPAGDDLLPYRTYPAALGGVVGVGGTNENGDIFIFCYQGLCLGSNYGSGWLDVAAPLCVTAQNLSGFANDSGDTDVGDDDDDYDYDEFCSTAGSAALAAGVAALVKSAYPTANAWSLENSLTSTAVQTPTVFTAYGEIRAGSALDAVDGTAPKITGASPAPNTRFRGVVTVGATGVSDTGGSGISYASLYADGVYVGRDTTAPYAVKYNSGKRNGVVKLQWRVYDRAGNAAVLNRSLVADNAAPKVKITSGPKNGATVKGTVTLKASASDAGGIARVELLINGTVVATDTTSPYSFKIKVNKYGKKLKVQVRAVDRVGNTATTAARIWKR